MKSFYTSSNGNQVPIKYSRLEDQSPTTPSQQHQIIFNHRTTPQEQRPDNSHCSLFSMLVQTMRRLTFKKFALLLVMFMVFWIVYIYYFNIVSYIYVNKTKSDDLSSFTSPYIPPKGSSVYSIVFDAGSTGTRIHIFKLYHERRDSNIFDAKLLAESMLKIKPGLSAYKDDPTKAADSLRPLLQHAMEIIPQDQLKSARLTLKATAGLRLLSNEIADKILDNIKILFKSYPFISADEDVTILDGKYEGIYSWITLNYALNTFENASEVQACSLDMGGGSMQVTFVPRMKPTLHTAKDHIVDFLLDQVTYKIFAKSFLGYGLMSARLNIFAQDTLKLLKGGDANKNELSSACIAADTSTSWHVNGLEYIVKGPERRNMQSFEKCQNDVIKIIENRLSAPVELRMKRVYAFSYYYDRLFSAKVITNPLGESVKLGHLMNRTISSKYDPQFWN